MDSFSLKLVTPEKILFQGDVSAVRAPASGGSAGVLAHHAPMITELITGLIKVTMANSEEAYIATSGGFMEVRRDGVTILADSAELSENIDAAQERAAIAEARRLLELPGGEVDTEAIRLGLEAAQNRLRVAQVHDQTR